MVISQQPLRDSTHVHMPPTPLAQTDANRHVIIVYKLMEY
jgi:hypothetical protein